jgi:hypothetical protein
MSGLRDPKLEDVMPFADLSKVKERKEKYFVIYCFFFVSNV